MKEVWLNGEMIWPEKKQTEPNPPPVTPDPPKSYGFYVSTGGNSGYIGIASPGSGSVSPGNSISISISWTLDDPPYNPKYGHFISVGLSNIQIDDTEDYENEYYSVRYGLYSVSINIKPGNPPGGGSASCGISYDGYGHEKDAGLSISW